MRVADAFRLELDRRNAERTRVRAIIAAGFAFTQNPRDIIPTLDVLRPVASELGCAPYNPEMCALVYELVKELGGKPRRFGNKRRFAYMQAKGPGNP